MNFCSIYIHIPFCRRKCNYCAFNSKIGGVEEISNYVAALVEEIKNFPRSEKICTVYFGGGTPTILEIHQLKKIFDVIREKFFVDSNAEITIEANPGTVDEKFLYELREVGFNRLSLGVQSFNDEILKIIGRIHDSKGAAETVRAAKKFFENVSVDLMYGLPTQKFSDVKNSVEIAASFDVQHISIYGLEIEPNTNFEKLFDAGKLNLPNDELTAKMYDYITEILPKLGYRRYEISNFAKKNFESRHNLGYWTGRKYFGFGAGAHSYNGKIRTSNILDVAEYTKKIFAAENVSELEEIVTKKAAIEEFCFLGLRIADGIDIKIFEKTFGENIFDIYGKVIEKNISLGLLENSDGRIFLTARGMKLGNLVFADFLM